MGIANFFFGGGKGGDDDGPPPTNEEELLPECRPQHYVFAHVALRQWALSRGRAALTLLESPVRAASFCGDVWDDVTTQVAAAGRPAAMKKPAFSSQRFEFSDVVVVVVDLPTARAMAEASRVAVVGVSGSDVVRYFTLELGANGEGGLRTVLCEWNERGHLNYGDGPDDDAAAFAAAVAAFVGAAAVS